MIASDTPGPSASETTQEHEPINGVFKKIDWLRARDRRRTPQFPGPSSQTGRRLS